MNSTSLLGYRKLLKTSRNLFRGDVQALKQSHLMLRQEFEKSRGESDLAKIAELHKNIEEAVDFMQNNLIQAKRTNKGNYAIELPSEPRPEYDAKPVTEVLASSPPSLSPTKIEKVNMKHDS